MSLLLKGNAVFLHIPKTGGNWVQKVLRESGLIAGTVADRFGKHADLHRVLTEYHGSGLLSRLRGRKKNPFLFCFVRHPLSWYESFFKYASQPCVNWKDFGTAGDISDWHPKSMLNGLGAADFNQFVRNVIARRPGYVTEMYGWYAQPPVNFIGRQESLRDDLIRVLKMLELDFDEDFIRNFKAVGVSRPPRQQIRWDENLRQEVLRQEYAGLVRYGYAESTVAGPGLSVDRAAA